MYISLVNQSELQIWSLRMSSFSPKSLPQNITVLFRMAQIDTLDHAESAGGAQEKKRETTSCNK
jgi:hypothetical protein